MLLLGPRRLELPIKASPPSMPASGLRQVSSPLWAARAESAPGPQVQLRMPQPLTAARSMTAHIAVIWGPLSVSVPAAARLPRRAGALRPGRLLQKGASRNQSGSGIKRSKRSRADSPRPAASRGNNLLTQQNAPAEAVQRQGSALATPPYPVRTAAVTTCKECCKKT